MQGVLHLIDNEAVDETNLNRYVLMRRRDVGRSKVDVARDALGRTAIQPVPFRGAFTCYVKEHGGAINLLLSPVDTPEGRRGLAKELPRRVINAATGRTTVTVSTHGFNDGKACLHCLYPVDPNGASREDIMAADMGLSGEEVRELVRTNAPVDAQLVARIEGASWGRAGAVGRQRGIAHRLVLREGGLRGRLRFVCRLPTWSLRCRSFPPSAGILLAVELVKAAHPELSRWALDNYFRVDTLKHPNPAFRRLQPQDRSGRCICRDPDYIGVYSEKYG